MAEERAAAPPATTIGGKSASLSSATIYSIAAGRSSVRLDSSALDRLSPASPAPNSTSRIRLVPHAGNVTLTTLESRAILAVLLQKLLRSKDVRPEVPRHIAELLNASPADFDGSKLEYDVSDAERRAIEASSAELYGISAVLDWEGSGLASVADAVAAVSCEAVKGDEKAFNLVDSGDGGVDKDAVGVASDVKVLLTGYNGGRDAEEAKREAFLEVPEINGRLREMVRLVHNMVRAKVNSEARCARSAVEKAVANVVFPFAVAVRNVGESSLRRVRLNLGEVKVEGLNGLFEGESLNEKGLKDAYRSVSDSSLEEDGLNFLHQVYVLLGLVWKIVAWEGITAFFVLEGGDLLSPVGGEAVNGADAKVEKKNKKKEKKKVLGKGTSQIVQVMKDRLVSQGRDSGDGPGKLEGWVNNLLPFCDPKDPDFDGLVIEIKEIVESNESRRTPKAPKGTRDFLKEDMVLREKAFSTITKVFKKHGATALDTPVFELRETLMGKYGEDSKLIYDLADQGGELCSLRYDLTVPFARIVAQNNKPLKRYQIAKVYRRDNPAKGRYREFYQCDFDIAGQYEEMGPDFEVIKILTELLDALNIGDYEVKLNHRKLLDGMLEICGVPPEKFRTICSSIDKLDKQSFEQVKKEMVEDKGLAIETADKIGSFVKERGAPKELLLKFRKEGSELLANSSAKRALEDLEILFEALEKSRCISKVVFDLSLARGLDYYTGMIFEAVFKGTTQVGSIAAGGRYDNLIGMLGGKPFPAVGVSLGIERVFDIMKQLQEERKEKVKPTETQVLVSVLEDNKLPLAAELVSELWDAGVEAEFCVSKRYDKHRGRVVDNGIPWMVLVGDKGMKEGSVKIRNVETNQDDLVDRSKFVEELKSKLKVSEN
ncbi:hypothetical protein Tsubulata_049107 [Turnera subulata]|uniref:Histidine--tRNA ligase, cytoplasmic n=1 Tax=Turnera subulata TaxID=218843 RepID=A0A9Q0F8V7_9ROSI|nr:hypothetical protein Tsubulata_049107 [Turnera subulata]